MNKNAIAVAMAVILFPTLACGGVTVNLADQPAPQQPLAQQQQAVPPNSVAQAAPAPLAPQAPVAPVAPAPPPAEVAPAPVTDPPTITAKGPVDCLPYPDFRFSYVDGIEDGVSIQPIFKAEDRLSEPGVGWYEVKFNDGGANFDCWVYGGFVTKSGDFSQLKVHTVIIPDPTKSHCDTAAKLAKARPGAVVWLPFSQGLYGGYTGWFEGMREYSGHRTKITAIAGIDIAGCETVYVDYDGGNFAWRVRDLLFSKP